MRRVHSTNGDDEPPRRRKYRRKSIVEMHEERRDELLFLLDDEIAFLNELSGDDGEFMRVWFVHGLLGRIQDQIQNDNNSLVKLYVGLLRDALAESNPTAKKVVCRMKEMSAEMRERHRRGDK